MGKNWQKGERDVAGYCERWWRKIEPRCVFCRTPRSGGWQHSKAPMFRAFGDVMVDRETLYWPFTVEVKRREGWSMRELLAGRASPVWEWWREAQADAKRAGTEPMLWLRKNSSRHNPQPWLVLVRRRLIESIAGVATPDVIWPPRQLRELKVGAPAVAYLGPRWLRLDPRQFESLAGPRTNSVVKGVMLS